MSQEPKKLSREDIAKIEIGHTDVTRGVSWVLVGCFVATAFAVPIVQTGHEIALWRRGRRDTPLPQALDIFRGVPRVGRRFGQAKGHLVRRVFEANSQALVEIHDYETDLEDESVLAERLLPPTQELLARAVRLGNEEGYIGRDGWLFYRYGIDYLTGRGFLDPARLKKRSESGNEWTKTPEPDPRRAIARFRRQLGQDVTLIVFPSPVKPMVHPEKFSRRYAGNRKALQNPSWDDFRMAVEAAGVPVLDLAQDLVDRRFADGGDRPQYLQTDTHWLPGAMAFAAERLKQFIERHVSLPPKEPAGYVRQAKQVTNVGDIAGTLLKLSADQTLYAPETVTIQRVLRQDGTGWQADESADVLFLGDSFSNIYSLGGMNWGDSAGLVEQLSFLMQRPIDAFRRNDSGSFATRDMLSRELRRGRDRLAGKKLVIWQFAARELAVGDWRTDIEIRRPSGRASRPAATASAPAAEAVVTGVIAARSRLVKPGEVPYKDHIFSLHLTNLVVEKGSLKADEVVVYTWSMRNKVLEPTTRLREGDTVRMRLAPWAKVPADWKGLNRSELDDVFLEGEPWWGEVIK